MTNKKWLIVGLVILVIGVVGLYIPYYFQVKAQDELAVQISSAQQQLQLLTLNKMALEGEIAQLQTDIIEKGDQNEQLLVQLDDMEDELAQLKSDREKAIAAAIALLNATSAKFPTAAASIEYDELLFSIADSTGIFLSDITASNPEIITVDDVDYSATSFDINMTGNLSDILSFLAEIEDTTAFDTALIESMNSQIPQPLTEEQKTNINTEVKDELVLDAIAQLSTGEKIYYLLQAANKAFPTIDTMYKTTLEECRDNLDLMALKIKEQIEEIEEIIYDDYESPIAYMIAQIIEDAVYNSILGVIIEEISVEIAAAIESGVTLQGLVGTDLAVWLGDSISLNYQGDIAALLTEYISVETTSKMTEAVLPELQDEIESETAARIAQMGTSSANLTLVIFAYQGEENVE